MYADVDASLPRRRGRGGVARYRRHPDDDLRRRPRLLYSPSTPASRPAPDERADVGDTWAVQQADLAAEQTDDQVSGLGRQAKVGGGGRRKAGSGRLRFQYPEVFGRRRARGGSTTAAGRRRAITSGRMNFRHRTAQAQRDDVTFTDADDRLEVSLSTLSVLGLKDGGTRFINPVLESRKHPIQVFGFGKATLPVPPVMSA